MWRFKCWFCLHNQKLLINLEETDSNIIASCDTLNQKNVVTKIYLAEEFNMCFRGGFHSEVDELQDINTLHQL